MPSTFQCCNDVTGLACAVGRECCIEGCCPTSPSSEGSGSIGGSGSTGGSGGGSAADIPDEDPNTSSPGSFGVVKQFGRFPSLAFGSFKIVICRPGIAQA